MQTSGKMGGIGMKDISRGHIYIIIGVDETGEGLIARSFKIDQLEVVASSPPKSREVQIAPRLRYVPPATLRNEERSERRAHEEVGKVGAALCIAGPLHTQSDIRPGKHQGGEYNAQPVAQSALRNYRDLLHAFVRGVVSLRFVQSGTGNCSSSGVGRFSFFGVATARRLAFMRSNP